MKILKLSLAAVAALSLLASCQEKEPGNKSKGRPDITIDNELSGSVKAGYTDGINIKGEGFDEFDWVLVGWTDASGNLQTEQIKDASLQIKATRITFGINVGAPYINEKITIYLDRAGYDLTPITGELTITLPTLAEGYIPDDAFRAKLNSEANPNIAAAFNACGLLDIDAAKSVTTGGGKGDHAFGLDLAGCEAESFEGLELFPNLLSDKTATNATVVAAWDCPNVKVIDISKWEAFAISWRADRCTSLEKFVGAKHQRDFYANDCPALKELDFDGNMGIKRCQKMSNIKLHKVRLRKDMSKSWAENPSNKEQYTIYGGDCWFPMEDNAEIEIDSWFLFDHNVANYGVKSCWSDIYDAWTRGATIKVYSSVKDEYLATVPMYSENPNALSPNNKKDNYVPSNEWVLDDPYTDGHEDGKIE